MVSVSTYGNMLEQMDRLKNMQGNFSLLSYQLSTQKKTDKFSGLGSDVLVSKRARASVKSLDVYQNNIKLADNRIQQSLTSLNEFKKQAQNLKAFFISFSMESPHQDGDFIRQDDPGTPLETEITPIGLSSGNMDTDFKTMVNFAENMYGFLVDLVNRQDGDRYLFAGADNTTKPFDDNGLLQTQMNTAITNWKNEGSPGNISTAQFIADLTDRNASAGNPDAFTDTIVGYSSSLASGNAGKVNARINDVTEVDYTSLANSQGIRDIMVAVSFLKSENLGPIADVYAEPYTFGDAPVEEGAPGATLEEQLENFNAVFQQVSSMITKGIKEIEQEIVHLETSRIRLNEAAKVNAEQINVATSIIGDVEDVDINEVAVKITALQTSIEASYRVTAMMQQMSLVNFI
jgi:flagellar hook-associated protein 3 FlgL